MLPRTGAHHGPLSAGAGMGASFELKRIVFLGANVPIILQNENGPCPLIAICNVLLLRQQIKIAADIVTIDTDSLLSMLAQHIVDHNDKSTDQNTQTAVSDVLSLLPSLSTGLDVNLKFASCLGFEATTQMCCFDVTDIRLFHGWLVDPAAESEMATILSRMSYNAVSGRGQDARV